MKIQDTISCITPMGVKQVPGKKFVPRVAAYGVVLSSLGVLLVRSINYKRFWLPGGGTEEKESPRVALMREIHEETSLNVQIKGLLLKRRDNVYLEHEGYAFDQQSYYYLCNSEPIKPRALDKTDDAQNPLWHPLDQAQQADFVVISKEIQELLKSRPVIAEYKTLLR